MSSSPIDPESIPREVRDGFVASVIGGMAMACRLLLSEEKHSWGWVARRVLAASLTAVVVNAAVTDHIASTGLRIGAVGAVSYCAPEALDALLRWVKARAEREVEKVSKPSKSKPHAKAKRPAKRK
jgi:hypothetical protein